MHNYTITGHMMVKNEANWVWYSIMSVIDFVDELIIFDTGSTDNTVEIIKSIVNDDKYRHKVIFEEKGAVSVQEIKDIRQEQIDRTKTDYFFVIDGDEIWYQETLNNIRMQLNKSDTRIELLWVKMLMAAGDVRHVRDGVREQYHMTLRDENGRMVYEATGSYTIRIYSMHIPGINCSGDYGVEGFWDDKGNEVQAGPYKSELADGYYFHASYLPRAGKIEGDLSIAYRAKKYHADWDYKLPNNFKYPEVFSRRNEAKIKIFDPFSLQISRLYRMLHWARKIKRMLKRG
mgnify:CR=1 FL=1